MSKPALHVAPWFARVVPVLATALLGFADATPLTAQDLGFVSGVFGRVHRLTLFVNALEPGGSPWLDERAKGCLTLPLCGAGVRVHIDLDTRSDLVDLELGLGAGYLRAVRGAPVDGLDLRGALRSLPTITTNATFLLGDWVHPYFVGSFGLVDLWNAQAYDADGRQSKVQAATFEYGISGGLAVMPPFTNGRLLLEAGYRVREFPSLGYTSDAALPLDWPRQLDLSGWQLSAGWQFDLRPIARSPQWAGTWRLVEVDGFPLPATLTQVRADDGNVRRELVQALLVLERDGATWRLVQTERELILDRNGVVQALTYAEPIIETGTGRRDGRDAITMEPEQRAERVDDLLVLRHARSGRRLGFRKVKGG